LEPIKKTGVFEFWASDQFILYTYMNARGDNLPLEYIESINDESKKAQVYKLLEFFCQKSGVIVNEEKFRSLDSKEKIEELKSKPYRLPCFQFPGGKPKSYVLTHGFKKQGQKTPRKEIEKAIRIKKELIELNNKGELKIYIRVKNEFVERQNRRI